MTKTIALVLSVSLFACAAGSEADPSDVTAAEPATEATEASEVRKAPLVPGAERVESPRTRTPSPVGKCAGKYSCLGVGGTIRLEPNGSDCFFGGRLVRIIPDGRVSHAKGASVRIMVLDTDVVLTCEVDE